MSQETLSPAFTEKNIPIFFSTDENYVLYMGVAIKSLIEHASASYNYDICILYENLSELSKERILSLKKDNVSIRFFNITGYLGEEKSKIAYERAHFTIAMYYRIFISDIFKCFDKVLYLDCDLIIKKDVAELYAEDLSENFLAAAPDFAAIQKENKVLSDKYVKNVLKINKETYFNSGVLLLNCGEIRKKQIKEKCLQKLAEIKTPKSPDQDILNIVCYNHVKFLPINWNYEVALPNSDEKFVDSIFSQYQEEFEKAPKEPFIIHYTGLEKPWHHPKIRSADDFWKYAKMTPWYEQLITECATTAACKTIQLIAQKRSIYLNWLKYKILVKFGNLKKQKHYSQKLEKLNNKIKIIKKFSKK